ncbi:trypsin-like serine peptidase [Rhodopirellula europaea]|uniref:trypsin-like serine peptidase n=1 Tax=Rhodopirellula europaea TaxID=1263866 RepID=UPI003D2678A7
MTNETDALADSDDSVLLPEDDSRFRNLPRSIIGQDDRQQIRDIGLKPYRWICQLLVSGPAIPEGQFLAGTGFVVDREHIVTAAHNLLTDNSLADVAKVFIGVHGDRSNARFGVHESRRFELHPRYLRPRSASDRSIYDLAVMRLDSPLPAGLMAGQFPFGRMPIKEVSLPSLNGYAAFVSGYPKDYPDHDRSRFPTPALGVQAFQYSCQSSLSVDGRMLRYALDTTGGQSGSPIVGVQLSPTGRRESVAIGIHVEGDPSIGNVGVPFDTERFAFVSNSISSLA